MTWVVLASFDANATLAVSAPTLTLDNYAEVLTNAANLRSFGNGLLMALGTSIFVVIFAMLAAYPLSRFEMRHKKLFMLSMLFMTAGYFSPVESRIKGTKKLPHAPEKV